VSTFYARKRWGRGRLRQLAILAYCGAAGHRWGRRWDGYRCCQRGCGACEPAEEGDGG